MHVNTPKRRRSAPLAVSLATLALVLVGTQRQAMAYAILTVRDFNQSVGFSYLLNRTDNSGGELQQDFTEDYGAGFDYIILSPQLLRGNAALDLEWLQSSDSDESGNRKRSSSQLRYNVNAQILSGKPYPITVAASSTRQTVSQPFAPSFDTEADTLTAHFAVLNETVPSDFSYSRQDQQTFGQHQNLSQSSQSINFGARPSLGEWGTLTLGVNLTQSESGAQQLNVSGKNNSASSRIGYNNGWKSGEGLSRNFSLAYGFQETSGLTAQKNQNLNGNLEWEFGRVLHGGMDYFLNKSDSQRQSTENRGISGSLSHRLLGSLTTGVHAALNTDSYDSGENRSYSGGVSLSYDKRLPEKSNVAASYAYGLGLTDRSGATFLVSALNEPHAIPFATFPRRITLNHPTFQAAGIQVVGVQTQLVYPASFYTVVPEGIELNDFFAGDTDLLITYDYLQDPSVVSMTTSHSVSGSLSLYNQKYLVYMNANFMNQELLSGEATGLTLSSTRHYAAGGTANLERHVISSELGYDKDYTRDLYYFTGSWGYNTPYAKGDLSLSANDRLTWQTSAVKEVPWVNSLTVQSNYRRSFGFWAGKFRADYANALVQGGSMFHSASLGLNLEANFGRLSALITSNLNWTFSDAGNSSSQGIGFSVRRSF